MGKLGEKYLKKFGWELGDGLGKDRQGNIKTVKSSNKFDQNGFGYNKSRQTNRLEGWWLNQCNDILKNLKQKDNESSSSSSSNSSDDEEIEQTVNKTLTEQRKQRHLSQTEYREQFKYCSSRTCHKGARHGIKMSGKLKRLQAQENIFAVKK
ncbi:hypothetical protein SNEBB_003300 [Seison nebaliae]|nr:hypothetical protein SNEBB_003300 [Seison nebaliae]